MSKIFQPGRASNDEEETSSRPVNVFEMEEQQQQQPPSRHGTIETSSTSQNGAGMAKHTLGMILLLAVVFLWTLGNFLGSSVLADDTYAKPFFLTYLNTSTFMLAMIPMLLRSAYQARQDGALHSSSIRDVFSSSRKRRQLLTANNSSSTAGILSDSDSESEAFLKPDQHPRRPSRTRTHLGLIPTARLALAFCMLWFSANYFAIACLKHTTVASATILTSTSSVWTLLIGALTHTERFTWRKLYGVLASLVGIILISRVDLTSNPDLPSSSPPHSEATSLLKRAVSPFPDKPATELLTGDTLALLSAIIYGVYTITLKRTSLKAAPLQLDMPLFFGLVGTFNFVFLMPLFPILHFSGLEVFQLPPSQRIWTILLLNSVTSLLSDLCWAYAMILTSPLVVTVGLSLTIPLSLVGEMLVQGRYEGWMYWVGAAVVVVSFVFVDREETKEEDGDGEVESGLMRGTDGDVDEGDGDRDARADLLLRMPCESILDHRYDDDDDDAHGLMHR